MQTEVTYQENMLIKAIQRLREAGAAYDSALRELHAAQKDYEEAQTAIMPRIAKI